MVELRGRAMFCSLFQFMISATADSGKALGPLTRRHVLGCAKCRRFHRSCRALGENLRSEAAALSPASRRLTAQILASLPRTPRYRPVPPIWGAFAAAACIAVAAWIAFADRRTESPVQPVPPVYAITTPRIELATTWTRVVEAPLLTEAQNLSHNAQSGIRFLVACLAVSPPAGVAAPQIEESGPASVP